MFCNCSNQRVYDINCNTRMEIFRSALYSHDSRSNKEILFWLFKFKVFQYNLVIEKFWLTVLLTEIN